MCICIHSSLFQCHVHWVTRALHIKVMTWQSDESHHATHIFFSLTFLGLGFLIVLATSQCGKFAGWQALLSSQLQAHDARLCVHAYIHIYIYTYIYTYVYMCVYIHMYRCTCLHVYIHICTHAHTYMSLPTNTELIHAYYRMCRILCLCICMCIRILISVYMYICVYKHTYVYLIFTHTQRYLHILANGYWSKPLTPQDLQAQMQTRDSRRCIYVYTYVYTYTYFCVYVYIYVHT